MPRSAQSPMLGLRALLLASILSASGSTGCVRFGYRGKSDAGSEKRDGGSHDGGAGAKAGFGGKGGAGGAGGSGGSAGKAGRPADSGPPGAGAGGGDAAIDDSDAGDVPKDAGMDAGEDPIPSDAGAADSGTGTGSNDCPSGSLFCDGFEDFFEGWDYHVAQNATLDLSTAHVRSGIYSLRAATGPAMQETWARYATSKLAQQKSGHAWMRSYNWVPSSVVVTEHFSVAVMSEAEVPYDGFELRILPVKTDINSTPGVFAGTLEFPRDQWVCVELHAFIDASAGYYEAYIDGQLAAKTTPANTVPADGLSAAEVGVHYAGPNQGPVEVFVDDVVVSRSRVPCN